MTRYARLALTALMPALAVPAFAAPALAQDTAPERPAYGPRLEGFDYPHPVELATVASQGKDVEMALMDIAPDTPNGQTVVLMHGKNFCAAAWEGTITALSEAGYRVIAPDQVGFCKSEKPDGYQYSFHQLAMNTKAVLDQREIDKAIVIGHSMGGMLASRFALMYPEFTQQLVMVNPLGLEDWQEMGVPYVSIDETFEGQKQTTFDSQKSYQQNIYYSGTWKPEYDKWVEMGTGMFAGPGAEQVAWHHALTADMIFTQPVVHEFGNLQPPTLLTIGMTDKTAQGRDRAAPELAQRLGDYTQLGKTAAAAIPNATLIEFEDLGHTPQVQDPDRFHAALLDGLVDA